MAAVAPPSAAALAPASQSAAAAAASDAVRKGEKERERGVRVGRATRQPSWRRLDADQWLCRSVLSLLENPRNSLACQYVWLPVCLDREARLEGSRRTRRMAGCR